MFVGTKRSRSGRPMPQVFIRIERNPAAYATQPLEALRAGACQPGSDVGPSPNPVAWHTPTVSLTADDFWIMADGRLTPKANASSRSASR